MNEEVSGDPSEGALAAGGPLGLYVHFPFCSVHCPYCDFAVETRSEIPHDAYADAVIAEIAARAPWFGGGGGRGGVGMGVGSQQRSGWPRSILAAARPGCGVPKPWPA